METRSIWSSPSSHLKAGDAAGCRRLLPVHAPPRLHQRPLCLSLRRPRGRRLGLQIGGALLLRGRSLVGSLVAGCHIELSAHGGKHIQGGTWVCVLVQGRRTSNLRVSERVYGFPALACAPPAGWTPERPPVSWQPRARHAATAVPWPAPPAAQSETTAEYYAYFLPATSAFGYAARARCLKWTTIHHAGWSARLLDNIFWHT